MKVSYKWLSGYFAELLPSPEELAGVLNTRAFEVESVDQVSNGDTVIDVDVLPNRSHDCLSHRGIAREIGVLLSRKTNEPVFNFDTADDSLGFGVIVEDTDFCTRFVGGRINGVEVKESPMWIKENLEAIGQRSINNIVDITNFVMFDLGKPMHAFDADKVSGVLMVRKAKNGEHITTLDGKDVELDETMHVIADNEGPLAIAGVKGGNRAEVTKKTKNILIESAIFNSSTIRKTGRTVGIKTDSSRRFENGIANELALDGFKETVALIVENAKGTDFKVGHMIDHYPVKDEKVFVSFNLRKLQSLLGANITADEVDSILDRFEFSYTKNEDDYSVSIPPLRLDLRIEGDLIEEVGRVYGYENIKAEPICDMDFSPNSEKEYKVIERIKNILVGEGYSEIQTYMFGTEGDIEVLYPAASDKTKVRAGLRTRFTESLLVNARNADLLGLSDIRIFEVGKILKEKEEKLILGLGVRNVKKDKKKESEKIEETIAVLKEKLQCEIKTEISDGIAEIELMSLVEKTTDISEVELGEIISHATDSVVVDPVSPYPFVLRDIAVWTPLGTRVQDVEQVIKNHGSDLLVRIKLFDEFEKDGRVSYAFNLVFQSQEKTLTDSEILDVMDSISKEFVSKGWEVR